MKQEQRDKAANELESAANYYYEAVENLREIGNKFPELEAFVTEYIFSFHDGDPQLGGIEQVIEFLKHGIDDRFGLEGWGIDPDDNYAEHFLLRWNRKNPKRRDDEAGQQ